MAYKVIKTISLLLILLITSGMISFVSAQDEPKKFPLTRILFIFDASQSMSGTWDNDLKINIARRILRDFVDSLNNIENVEMALRLYGHQKPVPPQDCGDTRLEVPFGKNNVPQIHQKLNSAVPRGTTPIAHSLSMAVNDFPPCDTCRNIILLITDGIEACDGDPCEVSYELQKKGIILKPFVIGIGLDQGFQETFDCVGYYYNAMSETKFRENLGRVITEVLHRTTTQVNLLDEQGDPTETNVPMTFYDHFSGKIKYHLVHTMNKKGHPDTLFLDHLVTYRLKVNTIPPIYLDSITIMPSRHTVISVKAPQGYLIVRSANNVPMENRKFIIRKDGDMATLNNQLIGEAERYITGKYDIEIPTIPRLFIEDVEIVRGHTTSIDIPPPGAITFNGITNGFGSIYQLHEGDETWVHNINPTLRKQTIMMQPGSYRIIFRQANSKSSIYTVVKDFEVKSTGKYTVDLL